jgi:hypothetical protein
LVTLSPQDKGEIFLEIEIVFDAQNLGFTEGSIVSRLYHWFNPSLSF